MSTTTAHPRTAAMTDGRRADTARRRQRVIKALNDTAARGDELSVTATYSAKYTPWQPNPHQAE